MTDEKDTGDDKGIRGRVQRQGEETIGKVTQGMLENPVVSRALSAAFETRQRATRAQEVAMGALNLPSAADLERLTRRLRSVSQRLESIEDGLDRLDQRMEKLTTAGALDKRLAAIEDQLARIEASLGAPPSEQHAGGETAAGAEAGPQG
jgi:predicted  nucleic acid-binding Zn-ribbon protein